MNFYDFNNFSVQNASLNCRTPAPTTYPQNFYPHEPCSYCSNPYHCSSNCPSWGQLSNFSYEQELQYQNEHVKSVFASL